MVYVHIPFCCSFCTYCDFYSEVADSSCYDEFVAALCNEIVAGKANVTKEVNTLYIGGGTPSVLPLSCIRKIADAVGGEFSEFTVEVNPEDISSKGIEYVRGLLDMGVTRISMGVQSFDDGMLKWMNRRHDAATAEYAIRLLRQAGVRNLSIDLIFGISHLDDALWEATVRKAVAMSPEHISAYQLSIESGSALASLCRKGKYVEAAESQCRRQYDILCSVLKEAGYKHYEISNFALPGYEAEHNSAYWRHIPYSGFGPGAHSLTIAAPANHISDCVYTRSWNSPDLKKYISYYSVSRSHVSGNEDKSAISGCEILTQEQIAIEKVMLGLRTSSGVKKSVIDMCGGGERAVVLQDKGFLTPVVEDPYSLRIPEEHFFISDSIISDLL